MPARDWLRPPRQMLLVVFVVAVVSTVTLSWLVWELVALDREADARRLREDLDRAADTATAALDRQVAALDRRLDPGAPMDADHPLAPGVAHVRSRPDAMIVTPPGAVPYFPEPVAATVRDPRLQAAGRLEIVDRDLPAALRSYAALAEEEDPALRAIALTRLAAVQRKRNQWSAALRTYEALAALGNTAVEGLPARLVARVGRVSVFEARGDAEPLRREAVQLDEDFRQGRLHLTRSQYGFYRAEADRWLGTPHATNGEPSVHAEALTWLWGHLAEEPSGGGRRLVDTGAGPALVAWRLGARPDEFAAVIAGPDALRVLVGAAVPDGFLWSLAYPEGRVALGDAPPRHAVARVAASTGLPWTLHLIPPPDATAPRASPRQVLLVSVLATVAVLVAAGWYVLWRGISREVRVSRLQTDFVAAVSHEFRSPLTSLRHIADLLATGRVESPERRQQSYGVLVREADRLGRLVEDLLEFGRLEGGRAAFQFEESDPSELVRDVVQDFERRLEPGAHRIDLRAADDLPPVRADREALGRALWNLLDNAVKYSPPAGRIKVTVAADQPGGRVAIAVRDEGFGIPADEQARIFDRFVRGTEAEARRIGGSGIGLAMARGIVEAHGGEIGVVSQAGRGSVFTIALPASGR